MRGVIHAFNDAGFGALDPKWSGGRPKTISEHARRQICLLARCRPRDLGLPFSARGLSKLAGHVVAARVVTSISRESIRQILRTAARLRATCHRTGEVWHMLAAMDLATGKITYRIRARKRHQEFLAFLKLLRRRWPGQRLYVVLDNFSPHKHAEVTGWTATHDVELVFLPAESSWLNWIEAEFAALRYFALIGTDHRTHAEQGDAIAAYLRWHNAHAHLKRNFAPGSVIRTWTSYQNKVA